MKAARAAALAAIAVVFTVAAAAGLLAYAIYGDRSHPAAPSRIVIDRGSTFAEVARQLVGAGVVSNVTTFRILARARGQEGAVRAGEYRFEPHRTQSDVLNALVTGGAQVASVGDVSRRIYRRADSATPASQRCRPGATLPARLQATAISSYTERGPQASRDSFSRAPTWWRSALHRDKSQAR